MINNILKFLLLLIFLVWADCQWPSPPNAPKHFTVEILDSTAHQFIQRYIKRLALDTLHAGDDSLQVRFWYFVAFSDSFDVFVVKKTKTGDWMAGCARMPQDLSSNALQFKTSAMGQHIWSELCATGLLTYPGMTKAEISKYADGEWLIIELSTPQGYRCLSSQAAMAYRRKSHSQAETQANELLTVLYKYLKTWK